MLWRKTKYRTGVLKAVPICKKLQSNADYWSIVNFNKKTLTFRTEGSSWAYPVWFPPSHYFWEHFLLIKVVVFAFITSWFAIYHVPAWPLSLLTAVVLWERGTTTSQLPGKFLLFSTISPLDRWSRPKGYDWSRHHTTQLSIVGEYVSVAWTWERGMSPWSLWWDSRFLRTCVIQTGCLLCECACTLNDSLHAPAGNDWLDRV